MDQDDIHLSLVMFAIWSGPLNVATYLPTALRTNGLMDNFRFTASLISLVSAAFAMTDKLYTNRRHWYYAIFGLTMQLISWMLVTELQ